MFKVVSLLRQPPISIPIPGGSRSKVVSNPSKREQQLEEACLSCSVTTYTNNFSRLQNWRNTHKPPFQESEKT